MNGDVQYDLSTLGFKNGEQLEYFPSRTFRLQQEINLSLETVSLTRLLFQYTKSSSKSNKLKAFVATNMIYLITFPDNKVKYAAYTGVNIHAIYRYL